LKKLERDKYYKMKRFNVKQVYLFTLFILFCFFTLLFINNHLTEWGYITLFLALLIASFVVTFSDRVQEIDLLKLVLKLYAKNQEGLSFNDVAISIAKILAKFSEHVSGNVKQRKERTGLIDELLQSLEVDRKNREKILKNTNLVTKLMESPDDEVEFKKLQKEIREAGIFE
jgi:hypothetical protein